MELEIIILNKSDRERQIVYDNTYVWNLKSTKLKWRVEWWLPEAEEWRNRGAEFTHTKLQLVGQSISLVTQLCLALYNSMDCSMPSFPVHQQLLELAQTHVH